MLYNLDKKQMDYIPHQKRYNLHRTHLNDADYDQVVDAINKYIDKVDEVFTSSFIPGSDWTDTPYQPLYVACKCDQEQSAFFFGQITWEVVMKRDDEWYFKPADKDADDILGMRYFRKKS